MANQPESAVYDAGVRQLETLDPVQGGVGGVSNIPLLNLANRTAYLKQHLDAIEAGTFVPPGVALLASPTFTGDPKAPTPAAGDSDTSIATTAFVQRSVGGRLSKSVAGGVNVTLTAGEVDNGILEFTGALTANISVIVPNANGIWAVANKTTGAYTLTIKTAAGTGIAVTQGLRTPVYCDGTNVYEQFTDLKDTALTGVPIAPNANVDTNTQQIATTAFVVNQASAATPLVDGTAAIGTSLRYARADHVHPTDTSRAGLASPTFTGDPKAPTPAVGDNDTSIATTQFVQNTVNGRLSKSVAGGVDVTLTAAEAGYAQMEFTGALTANINVIVPAAAARWDVANKTTGAYTLTIKTAAGTGIAVTQGLREPLVCDATNVYEAFTDFKDVALSGNPTAPLAAQFDNDTSIATTSFVQRALGNFRTALTLSAATTLTVAHAGAYILAQDSGAAYTLTLPAISTFPAGSTITIQSTSVAAVTVQRAGTDTLWNPDSVTSVALRFGQMIQFTSVAGVWHVSGQKVSGGNLINLQGFAGSGTYTPTPGTKRIVVEVIGGGGGAGGTTSVTNTYAAAGGGGGGGSYGRGYLTTIPASVAVTVGAGGAGGYHNGSGGNGGTSSFGAYISCSGGLGGTAGFGAGFPVSGAPGAGGGTISFGNGMNSFAYGGGGAGQWGVVWTLGGNALGGNGGSSMFSGGASGTGSYTTGNAAGGWGGGGGGSSASQGNNVAYSGGAGSGGLVLVWEYA